MYPVAAGEALALAVPIAKAGVAGAPLAPSTLALRLECVGLGLSLGSSGAAGGDPLTTTLFPAAPVEVPCFPSPCFPSSSRASQCLSCFQ